MPKLRLADMPLEDWKRLFHMAVCSTASDFRTAQDKEIRQWLRVKIRLLREKEELEGPRYCPECGAVLEEEDAS